MKFFHRQSGQSEGLTAVVPAAQEFVLSGGSTAVILVHGFAGSIADLRPLAVDLQHHGYTVIGVRLPGHGSTVTALHASTEQAWKAEVQRVLAGCSTAIKSIVMVGESMGALLALLGVPEDPRVCGVVLLAPPFYVAKERTRAILSRLLPSTLRQRKPWLTDADRQAHLNKGSLLELTVGSYRRFLRVVKLGRQVLGQTSVPVLAFFSRGDHQLNATSVKFLRDSLGSRATIIQLDGMSHHLMSSPHAQRVATDIQAFIEKNT